jgi:2-(1,2-epoxy-1,2-dihydrophenyl)acetyl-CoA isomerase
MMSSEPVLLAVREAGVLTLTLNRPSRKNALNDELRDALGAALTSAARDRDVRVVVIAGAGGAFCSGADLSTGAAADHPLEVMRQANEIALRLYELPKPTLAKVDGIAVGAGWNLALGCDLVVSTDTARFSQIFVKRGMTLDWGGSWILPRLVGIQQAKRLAFLGEMIGWDS